MAEARREKEQLDMKRAKHDRAYFMRLLLNFTPREDQMPVIIALKDGAKRILLDKGRRWGGSKLCSAIALTECPAS